MPWSKWLAGLLIPGWAFRGIGRPRVARMLLSAYAVLGLVFFGELGRPLGALAAGLMFGIHLTSVLQQLSFHTVDLSLKRKILVSLGVAWVLAMVVYAPVRFLVEHWIVVAVRVHDEPVVVSRWTRSTSVRRGTLVFYNLPPDSGQGVVFRGGYAFGRVEGMPGDVVEYGDLEYRVAGRSRPNQPFMPSSGTWSVPENHWFIWPGSSMELPVNTGTPQAATVSAILTRLAAVERGQYVGQAFSWWFWRRQETR